MKKRKTFKHLLMEVMPLVILAGLLGLCSKARSEEKIVLTDSNTVLLSLPIFGSVVSEIQKELLEKDLKLKRKEPIYLVLNTPGGSIQDGLKLIELVKGLSRPVHTVSIFSASMGFVISQHLDDRLVLSSTVMMSHRAFVSGIGGNVPGNFVTMSKFISDYIQNVSKPVAKRSGRSIEEYEKLIADDLWMGPEKAKELNFADRIVIVSCDKTLRGYRDPQELEMGFFSFTVQFHKCPLINQPRIINGNEQFARVLFGNKLELVNQYGNLFE